jgi:hypothetical protein
VGVCSLPVAAEGMPLLPLLDDRGAGVDKWRGGWYDNLCVAGDDDATAARNDERRCRDRAASGAIRHGWQQLVFYA